MGKNVEGGGEGSGGDGGDGGTWTAPSHDRPQYWKSQIKVMAFLGLENC